MIFLVSSWFLMLTHIQMMKLWVNAKYAFKKNYVPFYRLPGILNVSLNVYITGWEHPSQAQLPALHHGVVENTLRTRTASPIGRKGEIIFWLVEKVREFSDWLKRWEHFLIGWKGKRIFWLVEMVRGLLIGQKCSTDLCCALRLTKRVKSYSSECKKQQIFCNVFQFNCLY